MIMDFLARLTSKAKLSLDHHLHDHHHIMIIAMTVSKAN